MDPILIKLQFIQRCIETSYGFSFENISNSILMLTHSNYYPTRSVHDGKVDGINYTSKDKRIFYSMYGPKKADWKKKDKSKVDEDAEGIKNFLERHNKELKKWYFVVNHELAVDEIEYIKMKFGDPHKVEIITPSKFIKLIVEKDKVIETARFLDLLAYSIPMTDLQPWALTKYILNLLTKIKDESKEEKIEMLDRITEAIIDLSCFDEEGKPKNTIYPKLWFMIRKNTKIKRKRRASYVYTDGSFVELYLTEDNEISKNEENSIVITPNDLYLTYIIVKKIRGELIKNNNYSIQKVLIDLYDNSQKRFEIRMNKSQYPYLISNM